MKNLKITLSFLAVLTGVIVFSAFTTEKSSCSTSEEAPVVVEKRIQTINMFVTHGHCSTPFAGRVENLEVYAPAREDLGNPIENLKMSFDIDPNTFNVCVAEELTAVIKTPGLFIGENDEKLRFRSTNVYTMGLDWYQMNGVLSIKGVEKEVKFYVSGIRNPEDSMPSALIVEGQLDLWNWGIDYDKIIHGKSNEVPTKWMHLNMRIDMPSGC